MTIALNNNGLKLLNEIKKSVEKNGIVTDVLVNQLTELRPFYIESKDPLVTRVIRLTAEYIQENDAFDLNLLAETEDEDEEVNEDFSAEDLKIDLDSDDSFSQMKENFLFLLDLFANNDNKVNREELQRVKQIYLDMGMV